MTDDRTPAGPPLPSRRTLLKLGATGMVATGLSALAATALPAAAGAEQTPGSGQGPQPPKPPAPDQIVNLAAAPAEDWTEPWIWRPSDWPGEALVLNLVGNPNPPRAVSPGNRFTPLYSYNGTSPGPTIRVRGDDTFRITVRNHLGPNLGRVPKGPCPDPFEQRPDLVDAAFCRIAKASGLECTAPPPTRALFEHFHELLDIMPAPMVDTNCLPGPINLPHASHTTNVHTHGLHVNPGMNANGTFGDNTYSRILPKGDGEFRQSASGRNCRGMDEHERIGEGHYEYALAAQPRRPGSKPEPHPPGTHWYHPHAHGATHDQVASGLAGFLIVEGNVDDAINRAMTGTPRPDPTQKTGPYDYRERLMLLQRVEVFSADLDRTRRQQIRIAPPTSVNGTFTPTVIFMRPGAVERWRVVNGSVDGRGFKQFMVLEGQFVFADRQVWKVIPGEGPDAPPRLEAASREDIAKATRQIYQLSFDGITLVEIENGRARHTIRDLSRQNAGTVNPLDRPAADGESPARAMLRNVEDCYRDGASLRNLYVRPNQVFLANANRVDVFFKAPRDAAGKVYTVFAQEFPLATDNFQQRLQLGISRSGQGDAFTAGNPGPVDVVMGYVKVSGTPVEGGDFDVMSLRAVLPPVPESLQPVQDDDLRVPAAEAARRKVPAGSFRTRVVSYSGYGPTDFPLMEVPEAFAQKNPQLKGLVWDDINGARVLLAPFARTMAINGRFDLASTPEPPAPQKFGHHDPDHPRALVDTAEEWVLHNLSVALWSHTDTKRFPQPGQYGLHYKAYPISRAEGQARFARDPEFQITTKGADHPFHVHVNPCWVTRIEVPDERGRLHNILPEPRWMDTIMIPRGGRAIFRSRFEHYTGLWVNHCHILMHEDHGMMQGVAAVSKPADANYVPRARVASHDMTADAVTAIYPMPSLDLMYRQNLSFIDASPEVGQVFPGFPLVAPTLE
jgi:FtsP/CotA-like multicopper oxidase with cupredoxin domain